jgi:hypothetical protein
LVVVAGTVIIAVVVAAVGVRRADRTRQLAAATGSAAARRLVVIAGAVIVAVEVAAVGVHGADGTRSQTLGVRIGGLIVVAETGVLAVPVATLGIRGARLARHAASATAGIVVGVVATGGKLHEPPSQR